MDGVHSLRRMSKEEKMAHIRDLYYASMMNDLDIRDAEEEGGGGGELVRRPGFQEGHRRPAHAFLG
jgi:hypothetical protein